MSFEILFIGDIVGKAGRDILRKSLPDLIEKWDLNLVVANAENSSGGSGLDQKCHKEIVKAGVDVMTMGDHIYKKKEIINLFTKTDRIVKPANYPPDSPGPDHAIVTSESGVRVGVISLMGRVFMRPCDCPYLAADRVLEEITPKCDLIIVDIHAEATSDKQLMGRYLDGRVSAVLGTHTHVPTADAKILSRGTAYITDVGMTGPYDSILGRKFDPVKNATVTFVPHYFEVAHGDKRLCGARLTLDESTGKALAIERVEVKESDLVKE